MNNEYAVKPIWGEITPWNEDTFDQLIIIGHGWFMVGDIDPENVPRKYRIKKLMINTWCTNCGNGYYEEMEKEYKVQCTHCKMKKRIWETERTTWKVE